MAGTTIQVNPGATVDPSVLAAAQAAANAAAAQNAAYLNNTLPVLPKYASGGGAQYTQAEIQDAQNEYNKHMAAFHPEEYYGISIASLAGTPLSQIASRYGTQFADIVQGYYTEHPTAEAQAINRQYAEQQRNIIGPSGVLYQTPAAAYNPYPENTAAGIAWLVGRQQGIEGRGNVSESLTRTALSEGYTGKIQYVPGISTVPILNLSSEEGLPTTISGTKTVAGIAGPSTVTSYVPYGSYTQQELLGTKLLISEKTGELGIYQKPLGHFYYMLVAGGGRAAAQSGMFTVEKPETPYVVEQGGVGKYELPSGKELSRLGAETYGGYVQPLDTRTIEGIAKATGVINAVQLSTYANKYNLANFVDAQGVNLGKAEAPGAKIPWSVEPASPAIQYMNEKGVVPRTSVVIPGALPKPFVSVSAAPYAFASTPSGAYKEQSPITTIIESALAGRMPSFNEMISPSSPVRMITGGYVPSTEQPKIVEYGMPGFLKMITMIPVFSAVEEVGISGIPVIERIALKPTAESIAMTSETKVVSSFGQEVPGAMTKTYGGFKGIFGQEVPGAISESAAKILGAANERATISVPAMIGLTGLGIGSVVAAYTIAPEIAKSPELPKPFISTITSRETPTASILTKSTLSGWDTWLTDANKSFGDITGFSKLPSPTTEQIKSTGSMLSIVGAPFGGVPFGLALQTPVVSDYAAAYVKGEITGLREKPIQTLAMFGAGIAIGGLFKAGSAGLEASRVSVAEKAISEGGIWRSAEMFSANALPVGGKILGSLYAADVGGRATQWGKDFSPAAAERLGGIISAETRPGGFGMMIGLQAPGAIYKAAQVSDIGYKSALQEGTTTGRFNYYLKQPITEPYKLAKINYQSYMQETPEAGIRDYLLYRVQKPVIETEMRISTGFERLFHPSRFAGVEGMENLWQPRSTLNIWSSEVPAPSTKFNIGGQTRWTEPTAPKGTVEIQTSNGMVQLVRVEQVQAQAPLSMMDISGQMPELPQQMPIFINPLTGLLSRRQYKVEEETQYLTLPPGMVSPGPRKETVQVIAPLQVPVLNMAQVQLQLQQPVGIQSLVSDLVKTQEVQKNIEQRAIATNLNYLSILGITSLYKQAPDFKRSQNEWLNIINVPKQEIIVTPITKQEPKQTQQQKQEQVTTPWQYTITDIPKTLPIPSGTDLRSAGTGGGGGFLSGFLFNEVLPVKTARQALLQRQPQQKHLKKFINNMFK